MEMAPSTPTSGYGKKVRKPYTITKSRESWSEEEHDKFLEALQLFDRDWKKIEDFVGSKTVIQIRSHAQKYFLKVQKNGTLAHVPPPRPKRKADHPYPQKASKNASLAYVSSTSTLPPGYATWDENSLLMNSGSNKSVPCQDELTNFRRSEGMHISVVLIVGSFVCLILRVCYGCSKWNFLPLIMLYDVTDSVDIGSKEITRIGHSSLSVVGNSTRKLPTTEMPKQRKQAQVIHGLPNFAEVYRFIGSVFDPDTNGHVQKLKEMDPLNFETVLLLMKNLTTNLSSPDFEPILDGSILKGRLRFCSTLQPETMHSLALALAVKLVNAIKPSAYEEPSAIKAAGKSCSQTMVFPGEFFWYRFVTSLDYAILQFS
ncbi:hypothetical protein VNO78_17623 [Psophocarpus tetragonolobus]|uniref:Uncharacterized protein n=1 Tax=Psophocarpus tetragonolobus TaxID=3891 RepID=A0AAN9SNL9_PSOTE